MFFTSYKIYFIWVTFPLILFFFFFLKLWWVKSQTSLFKRQEQKWTIVMPFHHKGIETLPPFNLEHTSTWHVHVCCQTFCVKTLSFSSHCFLWHSSKLIPSVKTPCVYLWCISNLFTSWTRLNSNEVTWTILNRGLITHSLTLASMYSILLSRAVSFSFSVAKRDLQDISEEEIVK